MAHAPRVGAFTPRIVMKVARDGSPSLQMLDADGKVTGELVPRH